MYSLALGTQECEPPVTQPSAPLLPGGAHTGELCSQKPRGCCNSSPSWVQSPHQQEEVKGITRYSGLFLHTFATFKGFGLFL